MPNQNTSIHIQKTSCNSALKLRQFQCVLPNAELLYYTGLPYIVISYTISYHIKTVLSGERCCYPRHRCRILDVSLNTARLRKDLLNLLSAGQLVIHRRALDGTGAFQLKPHGPVLTYKPPTIHTWFISLGEQNKRTKQPEVFSTLSQYSYAIKCDQSSL